MKLRNVLLASAMMALPMFAANAQPVTGLYVGAGVGANFIQRESFNASFLGFKSANGDVRSNIGPTAVVSLGYGFGNGFRAEIEADYRQNNGFNNPEGFGGPASAGGNEQKVGGMVNVLYDFVGLVPMVQPYVGVGVGYQRVIEQGLHVTPLGSPFSFSEGNHGTGSFAYQAILGMAFPVAGVPGLSLTGEYRFMGLAGNRNYPASFGPIGGTIQSTNDYNHAVLIGMRYEFGVAPPPAAPAPMPVADMGAKTFLVFFDWDKADLTARSEAIVKDAANYSTHTQYTRIDVDGNTDTSGTPQYNMGLSERRARVVAGELVRDGVPQSAISMHAYGETKLLVPTGPGVREPQNRRVEIVFH
jgi:outer membrane protein OmpA-like peptidoglycan-associated protein/outer membrane protein W